MPDLASLSDLGVRFRFAARKLVVKDDIQK